MAKTFEEWHAEHAKYMEPADMVAWCKDAWDASREQALVAAEQEVANMKVFPGMEHLEEELIKRGLATRK